MIQNINVNIIKLHPCFCYMIKNIYPVMSSWCLSFMYYIFWVGEGICWLPCSIFWGQEYPLIGFSWIGTSWSTGCDSFTACVSYWYMISPLISAVCHIGIWYLPVSLLCVILVYDISLWITLFYISKALPNMTTTSGFV